MRAIVLISFVVLLTACQSQPHSKNTWPDTVPPKSLFEESYWNDKKNAKSQSLEAYLTWVHRFYDGWIVYSYGWNQTTSDLLETIEDKSDAEIINEKMSGLGIRLAREWAKDKPDRFVHTREMSIWGGTLRDSVITGTSLELVDAVSADLNELASGTISRKEITSERYSGDGTDEPWEF